MFISYAKKIINLNNDAEITNLLYSIDATILDIIRRAKNQQEEYGFLSNLMFWKTKQKRVALNNLEAEYQSFTKQNALHPVVLNDIPANITALEKLKFIQEEFEDLFKILKELMKAREIIATRRQAATDQLVQKITSVANAFGTARDISGVNLPVDKILEQSHSLVRELSNEVSIEGDSINNIETIVNLAEKTSFESFSKLDTTLRYESFLYACRYWEGKWLASLPVDESDPKALREAELRNAVMITPCFVISKTASI